jgi:hypothetical protein
MQEHSAVAALFRRRRRHQSTNKNRCCCVDGGARRPCGDVQIKGTRTRLVNDDGNEQRTTAAAGEGPGTMDLRGPVSALGYKLVDRS